jgi:uncharacterized membrane protein HdeD (DUF308 family)
MSEIKQAAGKVSKSAKWWGIAVLILGMLAIIAPFATGLSVVLMVGVLMIAAGVAQIFYAFGSDSFGAGVLRFVFSVLVIVTGGLLLTRPGAGLAAITLFLAAWFVVDGAYALIAAFRWKPNPGWGWMLTSGIVSIVLGLMIYNQFPASAIWVVGVLVGIRLMFAGMTMIAMGSAAGRLARIGHGAAGDNPGGS